MDAVSDSPPGWTIADAIEGTSDPGTLMDSASNAANQLHGLSLIEGFKEFVLNDPEVVALSKHVVAAHKGHAAVFRDGQAPGPFIDFHWPLDLSASEIAFRFVSLPTGDDPTPSAAISAVSRAKRAILDWLAVRRRVLLRRRRKGRLATGSYLWDRFLRPLFPHKLAAYCELQALVSCAHLRPIDSRDVGISNALSASDPNQDLTTSSRFTDYRSKFTSLDDYVASLLQLLDCGKDCSLGNPQDLRDKFLSEKCSAGVLV